MTIAGKHLDCVMGVDTHIVLIPTPVGAPIPTPLPNPYVGIIMDALDYAPVVGSTVMINGLPRAQAGTGSMQITPHMPLGGPLVPPPTGEGEVFMGSMTVATDGDAQGFLGMPVLTCQSVGSPAPFRLKGSPPKSLVLPTTMLLATPMGLPVMIGGAPTISLQVLAGKALFAGLGKLGKLLRKAQRGKGALGRAMRALTRRANAAGDALAKALKLGDKARNRVARAVCTVTGHPVDVATGKVFTDHIDLTLPGPIPCELERVWYSSSTYQGPLGHGWHHSYDAALYVQEDVVLHRASDGRLISFPPIELDEEHFLPNERLTLLRDKRGYSVRSIDRQLCHFRQVGRASGEHALTAIEDAVGNMLVLRHDEHGRMVELKDSAERVLRFEHDAQGRIAAVHVPHPERPAEYLCVLRYAYDERGNLSEVRDALDQPFSYEYRNHLLRKETDRNGLSFHFEYDGDDETSRCTRTWGDDGIYDHKLQYDDAHNLTTVTNSLGHKTQYQHQEGLVIRSVDAHGGIRLSEYDEDDRVLSETDALGQITRYSYDERGNVLTITQPDGAQLQLRYDDHDRRIELTDAVQGQWKFGYDERGRLLSRTDPLAQTVGYRYLGTQLDALVDPTGLPTQLAYDSAGNLTRVELPDGSLHRFEYDRLGRLVTRVDPADNTQRRKHDLLGRVTRVDEPDGNVRELKYDPQGNVTDARDTNHEVRFTYQGMSRLASRSQAGTTVRFEYDTEEQLIGITNEHGHVYRFELGPAGEVLLESGFDGIRRTYTHDLAGRVTQVERPSGLHSRYGYDPAGRITRVHHSDGSEEKYQYRLDGELIQAENTSSKLNFVRDPLGRILREIQDDHWITSEYNARGQRTRMHSSLGAEQVIERNALGAVMGLSHRRKDAERPFETHITRDRLGHEVERSLPGGLRSRWLRDSLGRPVQQQLLAGGVMLRERHYSWDVGDRLRMVFDSQYGTARYSHDRLGNLALAAFDEGTPKEFRMPDAVGNLFRQEDRSDREYGPAGQLLKSTDAKGRVYRYEYDAEGNLLRKTRNDDELWQYRWNADGTLKAVIRPDGQQVSFAYDPLGRRIRKTYLGLTTRWVWDGNVPLHEWVEGELQAVQRMGPMPSWMDSDTQHREALLAVQMQRGPPALGSLQRPITWVFEPESFTPMAKLLGEEQLSILTDHLGVPIAMHDADGRQVWSAQLGTWGELRQRKQGRKEDCPFRWPGQYEDVETGLYYNRFRYYDPEAGLYVSQDPIGLAGGAEPYAYVADALNWTDPLGLSKCGPKVAVIGEGMHRVKHAVRDLQKQGVNASSYRPWSQNFPEGRAMTQKEIAASLARNKRWLKTKLKDGYEIRDVGVQPGRAEPSLFYKLEQQVLSEADLQATPLPGY